MHLYGGKPRLPGSLGKQLARSFSLSLQVLMLRVVAYFDLYSGKGGRFERL